MPDEKLILEKNLTISEELLSILFKLVPEISDINKGIRQFTSYDPNADENIKNMQPGREKEGIKALLGAIKSELPQSARNIIELFNQVEQETIDITNTLGELGTQRRHPDKIVLTNQLLNECIKKLMEIMHKLNCIKSIIKAKLHNELTNAYKHHVNTHVKRFYDMLLKPLNQIDPLSNLLREQITICPNTISIITQIIGENKEYIAKNSTTQTSHGEPYKIWNQSAWGNMKEQINTALEEIQPIRDSEKINPSLQQELNNLAMALNFFKNFDTDSMDFLDALLIDGKIIGAKGVDQYIEQQLEKIGTMAEKCQDPQLQKDLLELIQPLKEIYKQRNTRETPGFLPSGATSSTKKQIRAMQARTIELNPTVTFKSLGLPTNTENHRVQAITIDPSTNSCTLKGLNHDGQPRSITINSNGAVTGYNGNPKLGYVETLFKILAVNILHNNGIEPPKIEITAQDIDTIRKQFRSNISYFTQIILPGIEQFKVNNENFFKQAPSTSRQRRR